MPDKFQTAFAFTVGEEGRFNNNPNDSGNWTGGACGVGQCNGTNYGISAAAYPALDIATLTIEQAQQIYQQYYWVPIQGDELPMQLAMVGFDAAVNSGVERSVRWLQQACNSVSGSTLVVDGAMGPLTLGALLSGDAPQIANAALNTRLAFLQSLTDFSEFGKGWTNRVLALQNAIANL